MSKPYLIIGAGIAGLTLAYQLEQRGQSVRIVSKEDNFSSVIAAGQINPLVFRRMTKSWRLDELLPYAKAFYAELSQQFGEEFYVELPIYRSFAHVQERENWMKKQTNSDFAAYMTPFEQTLTLTEDLHAPFGVGIVRQSAFVHSRKFVNALRQHFLNKGALFYETFEPEDFDFNPQRYKGETFEKVIFCQGFEGKTNPLFSYLPLQQTKGEVLTIANPGIGSDKAYNYKCFLLPISSGEMKLGATYAWHTADVTLTSEAKEELLSKGEALIHRPIEVLQHEAGIRPTVSDRRPLLGQHPVFPNVYIFNGLGTKGYMLAPLLSAELALYLLEGATLHPEVDIQRFEALFNV